MEISEKRRQLVARKDHTCCICGKTIGKKREYICVHQRIAPGTGWAEQKRHIHCDALLRLYAEEHEIDPAAVDTDMLREWLKAACEAECTLGSALCPAQCEANRFACGQIIWLLLRHRPGYRAAMLSSDEGREDVRHE